MKPEDVNNLIRLRRSIYPKNFTGEKVADEIIWQLLENANWAPTHKRTDPWRFKVFCEEGLKVFARYQADMYRQQHGQKEVFLEQKYQKLLTKPLKCSHIISVGVHHDKNSPVPKIEEIAAVACAVQNILLSVSAYGLGAYWSTGGVTYMAKAKSFFDLYKDDTLLGFVYLGVTKITLPAGQRNPIEDKVIWVNKME